MVGILNFDGRDDYVDCGNSNCLNIAEFMTIEVWIKLSDVKEGSRYYILGRGSRQYNYNYGLLYQNLKSDREQVKLLYGKSPVVWEPSVTIGDGRYHHLAVVIENYSTQLWVDGKSQEEQSLSEQLYGTADVPFQLGRLFGKTRFKGQMSDVRIWERPLTGKEIKQNRHQRLTGAEPGLIGYWPLDDGMGETVRDLSKNDSTGTIEGATWTLDSGSLLPFSQPDVPDVEDGLTSVSSTSQKSSAKMRDRDWQWKPPSGISEVIVVRDDCEFGRTPERIFSRLKYKKKNKKKKKIEKEKNIKWLRGLYKDLVEIMTKL